MIFTFDRISPTWEAWQRREKAAPPSHSKWSFGRWGPMWPSSPPDKSVLLAAQGALGGIAFFLQNIARIANAVQCHN